MKTQLANIIDTIKSSKEHFASFGETIIDLSIETDAWENVPVVDYATRVLKIASIYKRNKIKRNYAAFINSVKILNSTEVGNFQELLYANETIAIEVSETIFDIILEGAKPLKAKVLGNLTVALSRNNISLEEYDILTLIIQSCSIAALKAIPAFIKSNNGNTFLSSNTQGKEEALVASLGVATRIGSMFRFDLNGVNLARYGFNITIHDPT